MMREQSWAVDVRDVLPAIHVPTLVLHRVGNLSSISSMRGYLAEHIAGANLVELPGDDHLFQAGDIDAPLDEIEEFLTGVRVDRRNRPGARNGPVHRHRRVNQATRLGDRAGASCLIARPLVRRLARSLSGTRGQDHRRRHARNVRRAGRGRSNARRDPATPSGRSESGCGPAFTPAKSNIARTGHSGARGRHRRARMQPLAEADDVLVSRHRGRPRRRFRHHVRRPRGEHDSRACRAGAAALPRRRHLAGHAAARGSC